MRSVREITKEEEGHRFVPCKTIDAITSRRNPVEPEPVGTIVLMAFRVTGYDPDCDGSLMARLEHINMKGETSGITLDHLGLYPDSELVVTPEELKALFQSPSSS